MVWYFLELEIYVISYFLDMKNNSFTLRLFRHTSTFPAKFIPRIDPKSSHEKSNRKSSFAYCCRRTFGLCTPARAGGSLKIKKPVPLTILAKNVFTRTFNYYQVTSFTKQINGPCKKTYAKIHRHSFKKAGTRASADGWDWWIGLGSVGNV